MTHGPQTDQELLARVLKPYRPNSRYLIEAHVAEKPDMAVAVGRFEIPESCYIDDTGHFNAVEFNICYNQLGYYLIAKCVADGIFPEFSAWSLADFWEHQLSDVLIQQMSSRFKRMIDPRSFEGEVVFHKPVVSERPGRPAIMRMETECTFRDAGSGYAEGEVTLAFTRLIQSGGRTEAAGEGVRAE
ncbi:MULTISPECIES: FcoT family thioesterase [Streptomyces]|uniref:(2E)-enoyl-[ACP] glycyltransferase n=1 Tax=Streptomyces canarius TaxID=285453 RepID=A0ABQ3D8A9_9ACTN|nr:FcoT family thioesterase [Streptomyces canarius]GHA61376.1 hypothetical protein GCM10010345_76910 [Streptomyces canarius]